MANQRDQTRTHKSVFGNVTVKQHAEIQKILRKERITVSRYIADLVTRDLDNRRRRARAATKTKKEQ